MFHLLFGLIVIVGSCTAGVRNLQNIAPRSEIQQTFRLPNNTRPETYDIHIQTRIDEANVTFTGSVRIGILAVESTDFITLHHRVRSIESIRVLTENQVPIDIGNFLYDVEYEFLTIPVLGNNLTERARYFIEIDYVGTMNTYSGFYHSFYDIDDERRYFGSTQFEPIDARRAFPCYDEISSKATFDIRITHDPDHSAISNMPATTVVENPDGSVTTTFETTPMMSTYLIAFHVSDFSNVTSSPSRAIPHRIFTRPNAINSTNLALEAGELLLDALSEYVGVNYSLPKMDQVGVPGFTSAMENWGLVTYSELYFLYDESIDHFTRSLYAVTTISHELAHQFFGNLVTPRWWTYLWMKEGFATLFEFLGVDLIYSDWNMMDYFVVEVLQHVFIPDALEYNQPMTNSVEHPYEIEYQFNDIAYSKAGSVLRMFLYMFGEETFMKGVTSYLQEYAYSNAAEEELFEALDISVRSEAESIIPVTVDVATIMASWTRQAGFPIIRVERNYVDRTDQVTLKQERYFSYYAPPDEDNSTWWVPYNFATPSNPGFDDTRVEGWIPQNSTSLEIVIDSLDNDDYLLMNKRAVGYYRILYDETNYRLISDAILRNNSLFHTTNKAQLLNDAYEFVRTNRLSYSSLLDLMRVLEFDSNYVTWYPAFTAIWYTSADFRGHQNNPIWEDFIRSLTEQLYDIVGVEDIPDEPILQKYARESIVALACQMGSVHCRSDANRLLRRLIATGEDFHQNTRNVMLCASLRSASRNDFHSVWNRMQSYPLEETNLRAEIITGLGCLTSRQLLNEFLRSTLNSTNTDNVEYSSYEVNSVLYSILSNGGNLGLDVVLDFLVENAVEAFETYGLFVMFELADLISRADHIDRYRTFQNILLENELIYPEYIDYNDDRMAESVRWLETYGEVINTWLMDNYFHKFKLN